ncbi:MAG: hypothetical protein ABI852_21720 [Gemmatimonadaceae bacterium]
MSAVKYRTTFSAIALTLLACGANAVDVASTIPQEEAVLEMRADGGAEGMQDVVGLALRADSSVVVGDAAAAQVVQINSAGTVVVRAGRKGSLSGEYQRLQWVGLCDDSVTLVHDIALSRLSVVGDKMQPLSSRTIPKAFDSRDVNGCLPNSRVLILNDSLSYKVNGVFRRPLSLVAFNWKTGKADTLRKFAGPQINFVRKLGTAIAVPMGTRTHVSTIANSILVAESDQDSLWRYDGSAWRSIALQKLPTAQATTAIDDQRARLALSWAPRTAQDRAFAPQLLAETQTAKTGPRIDGLVGSDDGTAWVALKPNADGKREWIGYNAQGQPTGSAKFVWTFEPRAIRGATWWGIERDSIGVESVVRYRVNAKN